MRHAYWLAIMFCAFANCAAPTDQKIDATKLVGARPNAPGASEPTKSQIATDSRNTCVEGDTQIEPCGECNGTKERTCTSSRQWDAWSQCQSQYLRVEGGARVPFCEPFEDPAVFFSPHPDDETIGMGAAIAEHTRAGRTVIVEMLTDGENSSQINVLNGVDYDENKQLRPCGWHNCVHNVSCPAALHDEHVTPEMFTKARKIETLDAVGRLGNPLRPSGGLIIHYSHRADDARTWSQEDFGRLVKDETYVKEKNYVKALIAYWRTRQDRSLDKGTLGPQGKPWLSLKGTGGYPDDIDIHLNHQAVSDALVESGFNDVRRYLVNYYGSIEIKKKSEEDIKKETSPVPLDDDLCKKKRWALAAFEVWKPQETRYGIGRHSAGNLIKEAKEKCTEYLTK